MTEHKCCSQCSKPDTDGTLYILYDDDFPHEFKLWCGTCLRDEVMRLRKWLDSW